MPSADSPVPPSLEVALTEPASQPERATEEPELYVSIEGERLIVKGAMTSKVQQVRIIETLEREFPDLQMEKDLKLEYHRLPVAWGSRVADPFLVRYLKEVESPKVSYKDGIVTLDGKPKKGTNVTSLTEEAINAFSGDTTRDLVNKLVDNR